MRYCLIDHITEVRGKETISGIKNLAMTEDYLTHHFPGNPIMPGSLLLEALVQLAGWLEAFSSGFENWLLLERVQKCRYYGFLRPGDQVTVRVTADSAKNSQPGRVKSCKGIGESNGQKIIRAEFRAVAHPMGDLMDPSWAAGFFQILTRKKRS